MRPVIDYRTAGNDAYKEFRTLYPKVDISKDLFRKVIYEFGNLLMEHLITTGEKVKLPSGIGYITVTKYRPRKYKDIVTKEGRRCTIVNLPVNWVQTKIHGKLIYHLNAHTDGYRFRWKWFSNTSRLEQASLFTFRASRKQSRRLAKLIKNQPRHAEQIRQWPHK